MLNAHQIATEINSQEPTLQGLFELSSTDLPDRAASLSIHSADEINKARRAMTLGVKLAHRTSLDPEDSLPYSFTALSCGLHLAEIGASSQAISLGFLSQALRNLPPEVISNHLSIIERKFSSLAPALVELADLRGETYVTELAKEQGIDTSERDLMLAQSVQQVLTAMDRLSRTSDDSDYEEITDDDPLSSIKYVMAGLHSALGLAWDAYKDVDRKRGPELQPMFRHAVDVALLVSMSGSDQDLVVAGLLHDILEGYKTFDGQEISRGSYSSVVEENFGRRVREVIETLTEPPKSQLTENWEERKVAVLRQIEGTGSDVATVLTASKISTFSDGTKGLWAGQRVSDWSGGSHDQNVWVINRYLKFAKENGVNPDLVTLLELEATRFKTHNRHQIAKLSRTSTTAHAPRVL
jgi:HD domain